MAKAKTKAKATDTKAEVKQVTKVRRINLLKERSFFGEDNLFGALGAELIGTFILTVAVLSTGGNAIVAAVAVIILVLMLSKLSGGHVNPVVTLGLLATRQISVWRAFWYLFAQILGAMLALVIVTKFMVTGDVATSVEVFKVRETLEPWKTMMAEGVGAIVFGFGVASVIFGKKEGFEAAFTIGGALLIGLITATLGSSAVLNPAVALGVSAYTGWESVIAYAVGPIAGAVAGFWLYKLLQGNLKTSTR